MNLHFLPLPVSFLVCGRWHESGGRMSGLLWCEWRPSGNRLCWCNTNWSQLQYASPPNCTWKGVCQTALVIRSIVTVGRDEHICVCWLTCNLSIAPRFMAVGFELFTKSNECGRGKVKFTAGYPNEFLSGASGMYWSLRHYLMKTWWTASNDLGWHLCPPQHLIYRV